VTAGVAGELVIQFAASRIETGLRGANHRVEALLNIEAGNANDRAGKALIDAGTANERAGQANQRASFNEKEASRLNRAAIEAKQQLALAELQLAEVRQKQKPRWLPIEEFRKALQGKPTGKIEIMYVPDDGEAYKFALSIEIGLRSAGWPSVSEPTPIPSDAVADGMRGMPREPLHRFPPTFRVGGQPTGLSVVAHEIEPAPFVKDTPFAALVKAFVACGLEIGMGLNSELPNDSFWVVVGPKP
jgi:hypothetical protein